MTTMDVTGPVTPPAASVLPGPPPTSAVEPVEPPPAQPVVAVTARRRRPHRHWSAPILLGSTSGSLGIASIALVLPGARWEALVTLGLLWTTLVVLTSGQVSRAAVLLGAGSWAVCTLTVPPLSAPRLLLFSASVTLGAAGIAWWSQVRRAARTTRVVVVGSEAAVLTTLGQLDDTPDHGIEVTAVCVTNVTGTPSSLPGLGVPLGRGLDHLAALLDDAEAVLALPGAELSPRTLRTLGWQLDAAGVQLLVGTGLVGLGRSRTRDVRAGQIGLLHVRPVGRGGPGRLLKDVWERGAALVVLLLVAPLLLVLTLAVRRGSAGPAIFRQARVGRGGRAFTIFKLRTMTVGSDHLVADLRGRHDHDRALFKLAQDPRVTPLGAWLRRYSLDELPQLVNVVLGDMSLVGPRPALPGEVSGYGAYPRRRLTVKPGLTGLWQVSGRSDLSWEESVRLDLDYVDNWSLSRDLSILARTLPAVICHRGAY